MATVLAYTSPARGHLYPISALLVELQRRGHRIELRTLSEEVAQTRGRGFQAAAIDPAIEEIVMEDWRAPNARAALACALDTFAARAPLEVLDLRDAIRDADPDVLVIDANCWGAASAADASGLPWTSFWPYPPFLRSRGTPPFGPGLRPWPGILGRLRDGAIRPVVTGMMERSALGPINEMRSGAGAEPVRSLDAFLRRPPLTLVATGKPFEYPQTDWGESVHLIGPCAFDPAPTESPEWLTAINLPVVLVSTSSERQADDGLAYAALEGLAAEAVHVVLTLPAGVPHGIEVPSNATVCDFVPHGLVLGRAVCAVTHGGMGSTQKALSRGVPVCAVPHGRDQFEVARRVEMAGCGTRLEANRVTPARLRTKVREAIAMSDGARKVAAGFAATGGVRRGAELVEQRLLNDRAGHG
jgi:MGT family glycosyltransferase